MSPRWRPTSRAVGHAKEAVGTPWQAGRAGAKLSAVERDVSISSTRSTSRAPAKHWLLVVAAASLCLLAAACGELGASTGVRPEVPVNQAAGDQPRPTVTDSDRPAGTSRAKQNPDAREESPSSTPTISLAALEQPKDEYPEPKYPAAPKESAAELERIEYLLAKVAWSSAGVVDKDAETDCDIRESDLIKVGSYKFDCEVGTSGVKVPFKVTAKVTQNALEWGFRAPWLPVSEQKAVYEAGRQAYRPARVTCDVVDVELVRVDKSDGMTCWVTDIHNKRTTYHGELVLAKEKGKTRFLLLFEPVDS